MENIMLTLEIRVSVDRVLITIVIVLGLLLA